MVSTASKVGAVFGAAVLGLMLLGSPVEADPDDSRRPETAGTQSADAPGHTRSDEADTTAESDDSVQAAGNGATDAHPSPHERQTEPGGSGTQGSSESNPDGGGVDKPYPADGQPAGSQQGDYGPDAVNADDFDGNNGCGNDTDFSDDNNGNCGKPEDTTENGGGGGGGGGAVLGDTEQTSGAQVLGIQIERASATTAASSAQVLGLQIERSAPATLAATGGPIALAALAGLGLVAAGAAARRVARTRS